MRALARLLDANANRAREAMRVMEDAARFLLDDADLSREIKRLRHDFAETLQPLDMLTFNRDTPGDVGTKSTTPGEQTRRATADVAVAAGKRLSEALRAIEEYTKTMAPDVAARIEQLRYRGYDLDHRLCLALGTGRAKQWRLCVLLSESLCAHHAWQDVAQQCVDAGADAIQLREKQLADDALLERARRLVAIAHPNVAVIINDRPDIALLSGADGVHLGQHDLPCREVRKMVGRQLFIGVSTSRLDEAGQAQRDGADYCGVGPMFATTTKHKDVIVGPDYLREYLAWDRLPHLAIGGVTAENIDQLAAVGCRGVAVCSTVCGAKQPGEAVRALVEKLSQTNSSAVG
jgi:thiamine-phosphate pyrophosphorylase